MWGDTNLRSRDASLKVRIERSPETGADALVRLGADEYEGSAAGVEADLGNPLSCFTSPISYCSWVWGEGICIVVFSFSTNLGAGIIE
jgi:hypothetical protein